MNNNDEYIINELFKIDNKIEKINKKIIYTDMINYLLFGVNFGFLLYPHISKIIIF